MTAPQTSPPQPQPQPRPEPAPPRSYHFPRVERATLPNGIRLVVAPVTKLPLVTVFALVEAGSVAEPPGKEGVASLTAQLLPEGAAGMDGAALAERFEGIGASVSSYADWDVAAVTLTSLTAKLPEAFGLMRDLLRAPEFPEREVARLKEERLAELLQQRAEPRGLADEQFARAAYAPGARFGAPQGGAEKSVRALTREDVQAFYAARYQPGGLTLILAGDVSMAQASELATSLFGDWSGARPTAAPAGVDAAAAGRLVRVIAKPDAPQSEIRIGHAGPARRIGDYFDVVVMNAVLGGLFSSRINLNLREAHGYTYGAFSGIEWRRGHGPFVISTAVKSEVTGEAVHEILAEVERMRREPISHDELTLATSYLDGVFPIRYETTAAIASALSTIVIHELPDDYYDRYRERVRAVTTDGVLRAAQKHLDPDNLRIVVVGDPAVIAGPVGERSGQPAEVLALDESTGGAA